MKNSGSGSCRRKGQLSESVFIREECSDTDNGAKENIGITGFKIRRIKQCDIQFIILEEAFDKDSIGFTEQDAEIRFEMPDIFNFGKFFYKFLEDDIGGDIGIGIMPGSPDGEAACIFPEHAVSGGIIMRGEKEREPTVVRDFKE